MRSAMSRMRLSWVTSRIVVPCSLASALHAVDDLAARLLVERGGRLVGQHHGRLGDQRARDRHALALAAGELLGLVCMCSPRPTASSIVERAPLRSSARV